MLSQQRVKDIILSSLNHVKNSDAAYKTLELNAKTVVLGAGGPFDSIAFTAFAVDLEEKIEKEIGREYTLDLEKMFSRQNGKADMTVEEIAKHVTGLIHENDH